MYLGVLLLVLAAVWWVVRPLDPDKGSPIHDSRVVHAEATPKELQLMAETDMMLQLPGVRLIQRVDGNTLTYEDFVERFERPGVPVVITNYASRLPMSKWTPKELRRTCGNGHITFWQQYQPALEMLIDQGFEEEVNKVTMKAHNLTVQEYLAALKEGMTLGEYMDYMEMWLKRPQPVEPKHLIDYFGMPFSVHTQAWKHFCPEVLEDFQVPRFFPLDYMATNQELQERYRMWMPEAFIAPRDSVAYPMHLHPFSTSVWLQLLEGRKRWWLFPYLQNVDVLTPHQAGLTFANSAIHPNYVRHPEFKEVQGWEGVLEAGELLFMPAGIVHQVLNEETSYMVAYQYLDFTGVETMWKLPEKYVADKAEWREHLSALGLECWKPQPEELSKLGSLGDRPVQQMNATVYKTIASRGSIAERPMGVC